MSTIRITGGRLRGMSIQVLSNEVARYTSSKVRQAIFNMIGDIEGRSVLELFAGSGSFSIEALSRGAASATLVEANRKMTDLIAKNLARTGLNKYCQVIHMDVRYAVPLLFGRKCTYDIIFMDPPYEMGYVMQIMTLLQAHPLFTRDTVTIAEYSCRENDTLSYWEGFENQKTRKYGDTVVTILRNSNLPA
ncbi:MAG: 16S rRNA (guanine(966)-N(2))-methyltransferase RsmD [Syntrophorhabdaceae bacterium]|nr:16S rRNA (guanine(966)-N(2))-methyltransferase RsmD [Syntrophorhabdaceae bacterium]MDD4196037.1 16S rRNA (guanine(966)-N(2))-methyltransferase RsmD [Syntrophorhabdaceae bacterium]